MVLAALLCAAPATAGAQQQSCEDSGDVGYVCGVNNPEDLLRVDGTPYVLVGNTGDTESQGGGFNEVDVRTRRVRDVEPDFSSPTRAEYRDCPGPPDAKAFSSHGLDLKVAGGTRTVYAVNHGGRESIEVFDLRASGSGLALTWLGCALMPEAYVGNSVAALPDGGFAVTVPLRSSQELLNAGLGRPTGAVFRWSPADGWRELRELQVSFPNGLLVAPDGASLYVAAYTARNVVRVAADTGAEQARVTLPFNPDNLRWAPNGDILAAGQKEEPAVVQFTCVSTSVETCEVPTGVSAISPESLQATTVFERAGDERFGAGTSAIVVGGELWIGSFRAQRLLRVLQPAFGAPPGSGPAQGPPKLRLVRRCTRGRLRVELRGDVDRVRDVNFKFGKRRIARDTRAPFRKLLPRRALRRTNARRLRAVAYIHGGQPFRVILTRTLPRCRG